MLAFLQTAPSSHSRELFLGITVVCGAIVAALTLHSVTFALIARIRKTQPGKQPRLVAALQRLRAPALFILILTGLAFVLPWERQIPQDIRHILYKVLGVLWFANLGWLMISAVYFSEDLLLARYDITLADNYRARSVRTQTQLFRRLAVIFLIVVDIGLVLSVFRDSPIWHYGTGLLASAGLATLVLATAAKSTAENLLAGLQIALTEPIRLDDVVIVEGEWGRIEEITTTYVVVNIWDKRRLIVPLTYFIEKPFQNWTRKSADLLGTAFLYVDYSIPVEPLRQHFTQVLEASKQWDKKVNALQVTDICQGTMQIRCLASAANASDLFDLRCIIREKMMAFVQQNYPDSFPSTRYVKIGDENHSDHNGGREHERSLLAVRI